MCKEEDVLANGSLLPALYLGVPLTREAESDSGVHMYGEPRETAESESV